MGKRASLLSTCAKKLGASLGHDAHILWLWLYKTRALIPY
jgi:hypothetical protein